MDPTPMKLGNIKITWFDYSSNTSSSKISNMNAHDNIQQTQQQAYLKMQVNKTLFPCQVEAVMFFF